MLIFPLTHLFYKLLFLEKYFRISVCIIVQLNFNINVIKGIDHSWNIEMIFLNVFFKVESNTLTSVDIDAWINFHGSVSYELLSLFIWILKFSNFKTVIIIYISVHLVHTFFKSGNIIFIRLFPFELYTEKNWVHHLSSSV